MKLYAVVYLILMCTTTIADIHHKNSINPLSFKSTITHEKDGNYKFLGKGGEQSVRVMVKSSDTGGAFTSLDFIIPPGGKGPRFHIHSNSFETFHVLEGRLIVSVGNKQVEHLLTKGSIAVVAPGEIHNFINPYNKPARVITSVIKVNPDAEKSPANLDKMFIDFAAVDKNLSPSEYGDKLNNIRKKYDNSILRKSSQSRWKFLTDLKSNLSRCDQFQNGEFNCDVLSCNTKEYKCIAVKYFSLSSHHRDLSNIYEMLDKNIKYSSSGKVYKGLSIVKAMMGSFYEKNSEVYWTIIEDPIVTKNKVKVKFEMSLNRGKIRGIEILTINNKGLIDKIEVIKHRK